MEILWNTYGVPMEQHAGNWLARRQQHGHNAPSPRTQNASPRLSKDSAPGGRASSRALILKGTPDVRARADARPPAETRWATSPYED
jgi:hypothetical protein